MDSPDRGGISQQRRDRTAPQHRNRLGRQPRRRYASVAFGVRFPSPAVLRGWIDVLVSVDDIAPERVDAAAAFSLSLARAVVTANPEDEGLVPQLRRSLAQDRSALQRIVHTLVPLLVGGIENPVTAISTNTKTTAVTALEGAEHARRRQLIAPAVGEPVLRKLTPEIEHFADNLVAEMVRGGPPADLIAVPAIGSANHDVRAYPGPDNRDVGRVRKLHYAFGIGAHLLHGGAAGKTGIESAALGFDPTCADTQIGIRSGPAGPARRPIHRWLCRGARRVVTVTVVASLGGW